MADILKTLNVAGGGDYTVMALAESTDQQDLVAGGNTYTLECVAGTENQSATTTWAGWVTGAGNGITIKPQAGSEHGGIVGAGYVLSSPGNVSLNLRQQYTSVIGIELVNTREAAGTGNPVKTDQNDVLLDSLICRRVNFTPGDTSPNLACINQDAANVSLICRNCLTIGGTYGITDTVTNPNNTIQNCSLVEWGTGGLNQTGLNVSVTNTIAYSDIGAGAAFILDSPPETSASNDGSQATITITGADFEDYAGGNYVPAASGLLDGAGTDLSGTFTDDIAGNTRVDPWEIGAYEIAGGPAPSIEFTGPDIADQTGTQSVVFSMSQVVSDSFTVQNGTASYALGPNSNALPAGLSVNTTTGDIEGTPTESGTFANIIVRGTVV